MQNSSNLNYQNSARLQFQASSLSFFQNLQSNRHKNQPHQPQQCKNAPLDGKFDIRNKQFNISYRVKKKLPSSLGHSQNKQAIDEQTHQSLNFKSPAVYSDRNLKTSLKNYKVSNLVRKFVDKLRKNSVYRKPMEFQPFNNTPDQNPTPEGIVLSPTIENIFLILSILATFASCLFSTFIITFQTNIDWGVICGFSAVYMLWLALQIFISLISFKDTIHSKLLIDSLCIFSLIVRIATQNPYFHFLQIFLFFKLSDALKKLKIVESKIIHFPNQERYWSLMKMFLANFFLMHVIAIFLLLMSQYDQNKNWIIEKKIHHAPWIEQFCWAFYWSATTMLTIGFGDIAPANYKQALTLVLIEVFSCMALAFNLNFISKILTELQMKQMQQQKDKTLLKRLVDRHQIQPRLEGKLFNFIKESQKLERKYFFDEEKQFMSKLPKNLQNDVRKDSNTVILQKIQFFKNFANKTIYQIAQRLNEMVVHPAEHVCPTHVDNIMILKEGVIGLFPNFQTPKYSHILIDKFVALKKKSGELISMGFVKRQFTRENYKLKSVGYSIVQWLTKSQFLEILQNRMADLQFFQSFQDKEHNDFEEDFELIFCNDCNKKHSKFTCPRLHYNPIPQKIIFKYLNDMKQAKVKRQVFFRNRGKASPLVDFKYALLQTISAYTSDKEVSFNFTNTKSEPSIQINQEEGEKNLLTQMESNKKMKMSSKCTFKNMNNMNIKKVQEAENCLAELDKATNFEYYLREANPNQLVKVQFKKTVMKKFNSFVRAQVIKKQKILKELTYGN